MTLDDLQSDIVRQMALMQDVPSLEHVVCGLCEEAGEVSGLLKRQSFKAQTQPLERWVDELGDVLWYLVAVASVLGVSLEEVFNYNKKKLEDRYGPLK